jgi:3-deoxy-D-manno-octulosonic-acid transferase
MVSRLGYTLLLYALLPRILLHPLLRARRQRSYLRHFWERFGAYRTAARGPYIWVHAVSVGETRAAEPLVLALQQAYPQYRILLTHMTPTGRTASEQLFGDQVERCYLPYDFPFAVRRFLDYFKPVLGVLMETEIWFNLIHQCARRRVPIYLANARMSDKSSRKYAKFPTLTRASLQELSAIAAQTESDAERLKRLGAPAPAVAVTGSLKFDIVPSPAMIEQGIAWRVHFGSARRVWLAASTRGGEEQLLLDALERIEVAGLLLVIVPRHPQRFDEVAQLLASRGLRYQRKTGGLDVEAGTEVLLGDSMGEMFAYCAASDVAFVGGSLLPYGAHNFLEPCAVGKPVLVGPSTYNFADAARMAIAAGALIQVADAAELAAEVARLLIDAAAAAAMGRAALEFSRQHQGATQRLMQMLHFDPGA